MRDDEKDNYCDFTILCDNEKIVRIAHLLFHDKSNKEIYKMIEKLQLIIALAKSYIN